MYSERMNERSSADGPLHLDDKICELFFTTLLWKPSILEMYPDIQTVAVVYMVKVMNTHIDNHIAACDDQMYGVNCSQKCGACLGNGACHHMNGSCLKGCDKGYQGRKCDQGNFVSLL